MTVKQPDLNLPRFTQAQVLTIVRGLKAKTLQNWNDRELVPVRNRKPGRQAKRLYSATDIVKLGIMSRMSDLHIPLVVSRSIAESTVAGLEKRGINWNLHIFLKPRRMEELQAAAENADRPGAIPISLLGPPQNIDARFMRIADYTGAAIPSEIGANAAMLAPTSLGKRLKVRAEPEIDEQRREFLARQGIHAEPVIVFPIGEIVNGTLAQLRAIDEAAEK